MEEREEVVDEDEEEASSSSEGESLDDVAADRREDKATRKEEEEEDIFGGGLCGCFSDCNSCLCAFLCPCIQFGWNTAKLMELYPEAEDTEEEGGMCCTDFWCTCISCFGLSLCMIYPLFCPVVCGYRVSYYQLPFRATLREYHLDQEREKIEEECCADCCAVLCCPCCAIAQEARALKTSEPKS